jgi:hypothetical protein
MALDVGRSFATGQAILGRERENERQQQIQQLQQNIASGGGNNPLFNQDIQQLTGLDPQLGAQALSTFNALSDGRKKAFFDDAESGLNMLNQGNFEGVMGLVNNRRQLLTQIGGDTSDVDAVAQSLQQGDIQGAKAQLEQAVFAGQSQGFLKAPKARGDVSVQSSKILDDGTIIEVLKTGGRQVISPTGEILTGNDAKNAVATSRDQAHNRKKELKRLEQTIKREQAKESLLTDQQRSIQRGNIQRLGALSNTSSGRDSAIKKATKFKLALEKGEAFSGAGRRAASFVPGVFTSQGQFDEEFNAFAEVAARQQLKASGETRPTDADVQGMKQAMFGLGRDEAVNIQLLSDFIVDQTAQNSELDQLIDASRSGNLGDFTFTPSSGTSVDVSQLSDEDLFN